MQSTQPAFAISSATLLNRSARHLSSYSGAGMAKDTGPIASRSSLQQPVALPKTGKTAEIHLHVDHD